MAVADLPQVLEETGYDLAGQIRRKDKIHLTIREQRITLFIVGNVPEDYPFQTRTRKEISVRRHSVSPGGNPPKLMGVALPLL